MHVGNPEAALAIATIMRETGGSGVQSHVATLRRHVAGTRRPSALVTPFSSGSPLVAPVFGVRRLVERVDGDSGVWWYRRWHGHYLAQALRESLSSAPSPAVIYAQCPVAADAALRVRSNEPVVMAVHFNISQADEWVDKGQIRRDGSLYHSIRRFEVEVLSRLDGLVHVSEFMRSVLEERIPAVRDVPSQVIPNCVGLSPRPTTPPTRDLVTVGSLEPRKNHGYLLEVLALAAARGHRYTLTVVGDGPDRGFLRSRARALGVDDLVHFAGHQHDVPAVLARHRLYCHVSRMESFGIAVAEAMAVGLPVLATPVGGVPEVVRALGADGTWPLDRASEAAERLVRLMSDPSRRARMGRVARTTAQERFSSEVQVPRLLQFLDMVRAGHGSTRPRPHR